MIFRNLNLDQISIKHHRGLMYMVIFLSRFSKWAVNNSFSCSMNPTWWQDILRLYQRGQCGSISNTGAEFCLVQFFFFFLHLWWGLPLLPFKAAFPSHEVGLSWQKPFPNSQCSSVKIWRTASSCPLSSVFRLLIPRRWRLFTIWSC